MKKISISTLLLLLTTSILSCNHEEANSSNESNIVAKHISGNHQNQFEEYGILSYDLFELYMNSNYNSTTLEDISKDVSDLLTYHSSLNPATIHLNNDFEFQIESLKANPVEMLEQIILENQMSSNAETKIYEIIKLITENSSITKDELFQHLITIENNVISDQNISTQEKDVILLSSSLLRYSLYDNGHDDDKDWDLSVGNFIVSFYGASISIQDALLLNLSNRILEYTN
jgi:hypothetical protein